MQSYEKCDGSLIVRNRFETAILKYDDVIYVRKELRKILVYAHDRCLWEYGKVDDIIIRMDDRMCRCHSYLAINKRNVTDLRLGQVVMKDGTILNLCRRYYFRTKKEITVYWEKFPVKGRENILHKK
jgi:DNA-binding LytR/AlgR family response regulator